MSYADLLRTRANEVKKPPPFPAGSYFVTVESVASTPDENDPETGWVNFVYSISAPGPDIDPEVVEANAERIAKFKPNQRFKITPDLLWRLNDHLTKTLGLSDEDSLEELLSAAVGRPAIAVMKHMVSNRSNETIAVVDKVLPAEDQ